MASTSERGNAVNIANLLSLHTYAETVGSLYQPLSASIQKEAMLSLYNQGLVSQQELNESMAPYSFSVSVKENLFEPVPKNLTRLLKAYKITDGVSKGQIEDLTNVIKKYKGERVKSKVGTVPSDNEYSIAKLSYDQRTNTMGEIVAHLQSTTGYHPHEADYQVVYYQTLRDDMLASILEVDILYTTAAYKRSIRNGIVYTNDVNIVDVGNKGKAYFETILPPNDPILKAVRRLKFTRPSYIK